ncbi:MAG: isoprenylcysteine carboxyl methyltransferase family protein, partial [Alphaproteobacteria bacterium]
MPVDIPLNIAFWIVVAVAIQRIGELVLARRNTKRLLADGAQEFGAAHYPFIVAVHGGWLIALLIGTLSIDLVNWWLIAGFGLFQCGRVWVLFSLGRYWTTRIITIPDAPLVRTGPYRWLRHPNYVVVAGEIMLLPLAFG